MTPELRFSSEVDSIGELPEPLIDALEAKLGPHDVVSLLIFKPAETAGGETSPPKALAVTDRGFAFAVAEEGQPARATRCDFGNVLLVESAILLLYGHLKIDYVTGGRRETAAIEYNAVSHELYRRAATLILEGASSGTPDAHVDPAERPADLANWPQPLRRAAEFSLLSQSPVFHAAWWPSVRGGFGREIAPAGAVLARQGRLTVVSVEQSGPWDRARAVPTYGTIVTYLPADRIAEVHTHTTPKVAIIELEMHAHHGGERFQIIVPVEREAQIRSVIDRVLSQAHT